MKLSSFILCIIDCTVLLRLDGKRISESHFFQVTGTLTEKLVKNELGRVGLEYEMDFELETYEMTKMPELSHGRYIHDFKVS